MTSCCGTTCCATPCCATACRARAVVPTPSPRDPRAAQPSAFALPAIDADAAACGAESACRIQLSWRGQPQSGSHAAGTPTGGACWCPSGRVSQTSEAAQYLQPALFRSDSRSRKVSPRVSAGCSRIPCEPVAVLAAALLTWSSRGVQPQACMRASQRRCRLTHRASAHVVALLPCVRCARPAGPAPRTTPPVAAQARASARAREHGHRLLADGCERRPCDHKARHTGPDLHALPLLQTHCRLSSARIQVCILAQRALVRTK